MCGRSGACRHWPTPFRVSVARELSANSADLYFIFLWRRLRPTTKSVSVCVCVCIQSDFLIFSVKDVCSAIELRKRHTGTG